MSPLARQITAIARPGLAWAAHFIAIYALISASCAARALIDHPTVVAGAIVATVVALALCLWSVVAAPKGASADLRRAAFWGGLIFALACLANAAALVLLQGCGG
jgi:hypothetical protein